MLNTHSTLPLFPDEPPPAAGAVAPTPATTATASPLSPPPSPLVPEPAPLDAPAMLAQLWRWAEAGWLRRLDAALAAFVAERDPAASPLLLLATALLAHLEGRGHTCLPLAALASPPGALLGWPPAGQQALAAWWPQLAVGSAGLALGAGPATERTVERTADAADALAPADGAVPLAASRCVRRLPGADDTGQPLVLADAHRPDARLYLRRHWLDEAQVARSVRQRGARDDAAAPADEARVRRWLDRLFDAPEAGAPPATPDWQKLACAIALRGRFSVITGGPGTGKTYTAARLLAALLATAERPDQLRVALAAPTGKAAARLKQSIDRALTDLQGRVGPELDLPGLNARMAARTLHALLGARPDTRAFRHDARHPLDLDVLIVDEASMVHLEMMAALLAALPPHARLVLLGDKDQLASVEAGAVLGDLCRDAEAGAYSADTVRYAQAAAGVALPAAFHAPAGTTAPPLAQQTVMLRVSRRFGGPIGQLALAVNRGDVQAVRALLRTGAGAGVGLGSRTGGRGADASGAANATAAAAVTAHLGDDGPQAAVHLAVHGRAGAPGGYAAYLQALARRPPVGDAPAHDAWVKTVLRAFDTFRLLCAVRDGEWGTQGLNQAVPRALRHAGLLHPDGEWYAGRPVMVTRNDPALGVYNGDIGMALPPLQQPGDTRAGAGLRVWFLDGDQLRSVACSRLAQVETAYALTVHKSQGSEFDHTVLVLPPQAGSHLSRELVYTGITRARTAFTLVAPGPDLLTHAVAQPTRRASGLAQALAG